MKQKKLNIAMISVLGITLMSSADIASATVTSYSWQGHQTVLDSTGAAIADTSITTKGANQYQTPISGTLAFDDLTGAGTAEIVPFFFSGGIYSTQVTDINMQAIGNGMGGSGSLVLTNMIYNWKSVNPGTPLSMVFDAAGFFGATAAMWGDGTLDQTDVAGIGAVPASDGTYINGVWGYLGVGPVPMATTTWDLTRATACGTVSGSCMGVNPSGLLPLVTDTADNFNDYDLTTPTPNDLANEGIGGVPMWDGPFAGFNFNFDITSMSVTGTDPSGSIGPFDVGPEVPVPAAVWLFGSGLLGLIGVARKKTHSCS